MAGCGGGFGNGPLTGGDISHSTIMNSTLTGVTLENLANVDEASALKIFNALLALDPAILKRLIDAVAQGAGGVVTSPKAPTETDEAFLPTTVLGNRTKLLGEPAVYFEQGGFIIPGYRGV